MNHIEVLEERARERNRIRNRTPERKKYNTEWRKENGYYQRPNVRAMKAKYQRGYSQRPEVKIRNKAKRTWRTFKEKYEIKRPCILCKQEKTQAHHNDYTSPFRIVWLCLPCHKKVHREHIDTIKYEVNYGLQRV